MKGKRSQYSTEYLIVVAFSVVIILPVILVLINSYSDMSYTISTHQAYTVTNKIKDAALTVYYLGEGSMTTVLVSVPQKIISSSVGNNEILYQIDAKDGAYTDIYSISLINVTGSLPTTPGTYKITVESRGDHVWIGT